MRLEDMKKNIPETPEFIHTMIQSEVKKQLQDTKVVNIQTRRVKKWTGARMAAAIAVCVLVTSTIVYAGTKLYHMFLEKQGAYSIVTGIKADGSTGKINLPEKIHDIDISAGYIPEGMEWIDELHLEYPEHDRHGRHSCLGEGSHRRGSPRRRRRPLCVQCRTGRRFLRRLLHRRIRRSHRRDGGYRESMESGREARRPQRGDPPSRSDRWLLCAVPL